MRLSSVLALSVLWLAACDQAPGIPEVSGRAPLVSDLTITPDALTRDAIAEGQISGGIASVPITITARAVDPDGEVADVQVVVARPVGGLTPLVTAPMALESGTQYAARFTLPLPLGETGTYAVLVVARDQAGVVGQVLGRFTYFEQGGPPVIENVVATPNPFPVTGGTLTLTATVSDPEGLANVLRVEVQAPNGDTFRLFDDGRSFGDQVADDGVFTASFSVEAGAFSAGEQTFVFRATDRSEQQSALVSLVVTVQ